MPGTIVISATVGRTLRKRGPGVLARDVIGCAGDFRAGDTVFVITRGVDGGQSAFASGVVRYDQAALDRIRAATASERAETVIRDEDLVLLWGARM